MRPGEAMRLALRDLYANSWRLVPVNAALGAVLLAVGVAAVSVRGALVLVILAGPIAAALVHSAVTLVRTGNLALVDALEGLRLHWRRGLALGAAGAALGVLGVLAVRFYRGSPYAWPLVFLTVYLLVLLGIYQVLVWTLAIAEPDRPLRAVAGEAAALGAARPGSTLLLGLALLLVNLAGVAAALMPFLTLTVAYSFIAVAHFALPRPMPEEHA
ncbi:MAG TPA: hypothetical protein VKP14_01505 [Gaiellaceae bacterium]|nr:hypothetical protein [Gaiellaceae bacterium]